MKIIADWCNSRLHVCTVQESSMNSISVNLLKKFFASYFSSSSVIEAIEVSAVHRAVIGENGY